jgi:hypothetical protein
MLADQVRYNSPQMPEDEHEDEAGQSGGQGDQESDDPGEFQVNWEIRERDPAGYERRTASSESTAENAEKESPPDDSDDPGEFEVGYGTKELGGRPNR